ncbi:MAG TPA: phosphatase [Methylomusa anaerophila]|uniref:Putative phosphatase YcdX n=1 Tax=Methylomusa anaerophila TaxID=1930071 RepID=A0A348AL07_9FIRM|nr:phosphatase [Methylomusa anaerophila]BBB91755.1 putative phosphatase YcdX [Methylomusa anaerophila]HML88508.1 phosphatase [Methylomusa anaerophila]
MKFVADLHIHTIASGHAYSTVLEIARAAADKGLQMIALTDHGPAMPGGPHAYHFGNLTAIPGEIYGVKILKGVEANVIDRKGKLDLDDGRLAKQDIVLAGLHTLCAPEGSVAENTEMMINTMKNPWVDIVVHPGNPEFPVDEEAIVQAAAEYGVAIEINNSSLTISRKGSMPHCDHIACLAKRYGVIVSVSSDSHFAFTVGEFDVANQLLEKHGIKEEMVLNTSIQRVLSHLERRKNRVR